MDEIKLTLPDGKTITASKGALLMDAAKGAIDSDVVAARLNGELIDLARPLTAGGSLGFVKVSTPEGMEVLRHSTSHVMAQAVKELFPSAKVTIGPAIKDGFYYDFDYPPGFKPDDLEKIEKRMQEIINSGAKFEREVVKRDDAVKKFE